MNNYDRKQLMCMIQQYCFAVVDIGLFLNTHPDNCEALALYHKYNTAYQECMKQYANNYGPITNHDVNSDNYWTWVNDPWPWEGEVC